MAIVKLALRQRERLATIRAQDGILVVQTMLWPDEVRKPHFSFMDDEVDVRPQELEMASMFVNAFDEGFDPSQFHDRYREVLRELVDAKIAGQEIARPVETAPESNVIDLMEALRASVAAAEDKPAKKKPAAKKAAGQEGGQGTGEEGHGQDNQEHRQEDHQGTREEDHCQEVDEEGHRAAQDRLGTRAAPRADPDPSSRSNASTMSRWLRPASATSSQLLGAATKGRARPRSE